LEDHRVAIPEERPQAFEHFYIALEAATAGIGVAIASRLMVIDALASGVLVAPFGFAPDGSRYELLSEVEIGPSSELAPLRDFLLELAREDPGPA
jgi:DNA-binding transcriptional LysR family regulator